MRLNGATKKIKSQYLHIGSIFRVRTGNVDYGLNRSSNSSGLLYSVYKTHR